MTKRRRSETNGIRCSDADGPHLTNESGGSDDANCGGVGELGRLIIERAKLVEIAKRESSLTPEQRQAKHETRQAAVVAVDKLIQHVQNKIKEIDGILAWNRDTGQKSGDAKLRNFRQVYRDDVLYLLAQLRDKISAGEYEANATLLPER